MAQLVKININILHQRKETRMEKKCKDMEREKECMLRWFGGWRASVAHMSSFLLKKKKKENWRIRVPGDQQKLMPNVASLFQSPSLFLSFSFTLSISFFHLFCSIFLSLFSHLNTVAFTRNQTPAYSNVHTKTKTKTLCTN